MTVDAKKMPDAEIPIRLFDGLDLRLEDDRAIFRMRVSHHFRSTSLEALREWAGVPKATIRYWTLRRIADQWLAWAQDR